MIEGMNGAFEQCVAEINGAFEGRNAGTVSAVHIFEALRKLPIHTMKGSYLWTWFINQDSKGNQTLEPEFLKYLRFFESRPHLRPHVAMLLQVLIFSVLRNEPTEQFRESANLIISLSRFSNVDELAEASEVGGVQNQTHEKVHHATQDPTRHRPAHASNMPQA